MNESIDKYKTKRQKNDDKIKKIAIDLECSEKQVRNVLYGKSGNTNRQMTALAEAIRVSYRILEEKELEARTAIRKIKKNQLEAAA